MGYILPIQHDTYRNYQYRMYKQDKSPHEVRGVRTVKFNPIQADVDFYKQNQPLEKKSVNRTSQDENVMAYKVTPKQEEELSGKGYYVNLKV